MPRTDDSVDEMVARAVALAQDVAPDLEFILLTVFPDSDTLDTLRPGETDYEAVAAVNQAVAIEMAEAGVEVFVQHAEKAVFRRWMRGRDDTSETRRAWINRNGLIRGDAAMKGLGLPALDTPPRPTFGKSPGPTSDSLLAAFTAENGEYFRPLFEALLDAGRTDVLDLAVRKLDLQEGEVAADELFGSMLEAAEGARVGPSGWAELVVLPVGLPVGGTPDAVELADGLIASGALDPAEEVRFLPGWRSPDVIEGLEPGAVRRVLLDLVAGREPQDAPLGDTDDLASRGFGVLLGLRIDWAIPIWDEIAAAGGVPTDVDDETLEEARRITLFEHWRRLVFQKHEGCVPLSLVAPIEVGADIAAFLEDAGDQTAGLVEVKELIATLRSEAGGEDVVCRAEIIGTSLELSIYTDRGRFLDSVTLFADQMPVTAEDIVRVIGSIVHVVKDTPGS